MKASDYMRQENPVLWEEKTCFLEEDSEPDGVGFIAACAWGYAVANKAGWETAYDKFHDETGEEFSWAPHVKVTHEIFPEVPVKLIVQTSDMHMKGAGDRHKIADYLAERGY